MVDKSTQREAGASQTFRLVVIGNDGFYAHRDNQVAASLEEAMKLAVDAFNPLTIEQLIAFQEADEDIVTRGQTFEIRRRITVELVIVRCVLRELQAAGYTVGAQSSESDADVTGDENAMIEELFSVDEAQIHTSKDGRESYVLLVFGNDDYDVVADHGSSLSHVIDPLHDWFNSFDTRG